MAVVGEWVAKAENDLKSAAHLLTMKDCPVDNVCFNAQQCVEKYLKALF
jgi:HEPN domain-containing protein